MATQSSSQTHQADPPNQLDESAFYKKFFEEATVRLTNYEVIADRCMARVQREYSIDQMDAFAIRYNRVLAAFDADPDRNPAHIMPTTAAGDQEYMRKCDECAAMNPDAVSFEECLRIFCAVNCGAQFISQRLEGHKDEALIMRTASANSYKIRHPNEAAKLRGEERTREAYETICIGQVVWLTADVPAGRQQYRLVDRCSSAMKGEFWTYEEVGKDQPQQIELWADEVSDRFLSFV